MAKHIWHRIRLFRDSKKESYFALNKILGFFPKNISLYEEALTHKSSFIENENGRYRNNERLEFLGDAILNAIVADIVFKKFRNRREGFLTNTRSKIVKRETLDKIGKAIGLDKLVLSSSNLSSQKNHILGNALEAFVGAVYLDQGYRKTYSFIQYKLLEPYIDIEVLAKQEVNFKSKLLEWAQKYKVNLGYEIIERFVNDDHNTIFQSQVLLNGLVAGVGTGSSKKESEQQASKLALKKIKKDKSFEEEILAILPTKDIPDSEGNEVEDTTLEES